MKLVVLSGPPGVGKLTVASELGRLTGYKVFDNHLSNDAVRPVFDYGTPSMGKLVEVIRFAVLDEAARRGVDTVYTFVYAHGEPRDEQHVRRLCRVIERHGGEVCFVQLLCDSGVNEERLQSPGRENKLQSVETLRRFLSELDLRPPVSGLASLTIDNTELLPEDVAMRIAEHYLLPLV